MKNGAADYISKPFAPDLLLEKVRNALSQRTMPLDEISLKEEVRLHHGFHQFIGESKEMQKVYHRIMHVAATNSTVLITGESGTGKELFALAISSYDLLPLRMVLRCSMRLSPEAAPMPSRVN